MKKPTKANAEKFMQDIEGDQVFFLGDGSVFKNLKELASGLRKMKKDQYTYHVNAEKNDFANWVQFVIGDKDLSAEMRKAKSKAALVKTLSARLKQY